MGVVNSTAAAGFEFPSLQGASSAGHLTEDSVGQWGESSSETSNVNRKAAFFARVSAICARFPDGIPDLTTGLPMPNSDLLVLKQISSRVVWDRGIRPEDRNRMIDLLQEFEQCSLSGMPNLNHRRLAELFSQILIAGGPMIIQNKRFQNAYAHWMNSAQYNVTVWGFFEYCYAPVLESIWSRSILPPFSPRPRLPTAFLASTARAWHFFASTNVRDFPQLATPLSQHAVTLDVSKMNRRRLMVNQKNSKKPDHEMLMKAALLRRRAKEEKNTESHEDLVKRAFKPGLTEDPILFQQTLDIEKEFWGITERQRKEEEKNTKQHKPMHNCRCDACTDVFGPGGA